MLFVRLKIGAGMFGMALKKCELLPLDFMGKNKQAPYKYGMFYD